MSVMKKMVDGKEVLDMDGMLAAGWLWKDINWCTEEAFTEVRRLCGEEGVDWILLAATQTKKQTAEKIETLWRGQVLLSPKSIELLKEAITKRTPT